MRKGYIMSIINFEACKSDEQLKELADFAKSIWNEYFPSLITQDQIDYMLDKFQSYPAMYEQVKHNQYHYYLVKNGDEKIGYIGLQNQPDRLFLSKFYLKKDARGHHYASDMFEFVKQKADEYCYQAIYLTCNKGNKHSLDVYEKFGFQWIDSDETDIGEGYIMDDYIYEYRMKKI